MPKLICNRCFDSTTCREILRRYRRGRVSQRQLAREYNCSPKTIAKLLKLNIAIDEYIRLASQTKNLWFKQY